MAILNGFPPEPKFDPLGSISENTNKKSDPLMDLGGNSLKLDGGGIYNTKKKLENNTPKQKSLKDPNIDNLEKPNNIENIEGIDSIFEKNKNNPATPLLVKVLDFDFVESFSTKDLDNIYKNLKLTDSNDDPLSNLIKAFDKSGINGALTSVLIKISSNSDIRLKESKDGEVELPKEFKSNKLLNSPKYKEISGLLANNYISFPLDQNGTTNFEEDLQLTFETTVNKITYNKEILNKDSIGYQNALQSIEFGDLENKLEALQYVYSFVNTSEGMKGAKTKDKFNKIKENHFDNKKEYYDFKVKQINKQITESKDKIEESNLEIELKELMEELKKDDFKGEVFKAGKPDKSPEGKEKDPFEIT